MQEPTPEDLREEKETLSDVQELILDRHPNPAERPEAVQGLLFEVGKRWNEITDMLHNYEEYGSFEKPEIQGSGMNVYDPIHTGSR